MFKRYWWMFFVMVPLGSLAGLLVAAAITYLMPKKYVSEAVIRVMQRHQPPGMETSGPQAPQQPAMEAEILKSRKTLEQVAVNLQLPNRWNVDMETVIRILKGIVEIHRIDGTDLIAIRVRHTNRVDARDIAGEIATVYKANLAEIDGRESERHIQEINNMIRDREDKVQEHRKVLATIMRTKGITYKGPYSDSFADVHEERAALEKSQQQQLEQEKTQLESQITSLLKYDSDQLMVYASGLDHPDNVIRKLYPLYLETKGALESMKVKGLSEKHPSVLVAVDQFETIEMQLEEGVVNLRETLKVRLGQIEARLRSAKGWNWRFDAQDYVDAKRGFETEQELLQQLKLKLMGETISRKMVSDSVQIHEEPVIAQAPISPNVTLNLLLGAGLGFLLSPLMWLLNRARPAQAPG